MSILLAHTLGTPLQQPQVLLHTIHLLVHLQQLPRSIGSTFQVLLSHSGSMCQNRLHSHIFATKVRCLLITDFHVCAAVSNTKDNPPCNTLFVGNLGDTVNEPELRQLFGTLAGFRQLKLIRGARSVTCFVEFADLPSAMACHQNQQVHSMRWSLKGQSYLLPMHACQSDMSCFMVETHMLQQEMQDTALIL